jgi:hypothetical protein
MHFIHFNRAGNGIAAMPTPGSKPTQSQQGGSAKGLVNVCSHEQQQETGFCRSSQVIELLAR